MNKVPDDRIVELASYKRATIYGVGRWRAEIVPHPYKSGWYWRAWDVLDKSLGGDGTIASGRAKTKRQAMGCLDILRKKAGIEPIAEGGGGPVEGN
jgi:hypothetical protein